jgi:phosphopantothenoylcysteine decarboxylase / phosphopantothenate---cysteine ligase
VSGQGSPRARVVLGVGGGIAAYKVAGLLRLLTEGGADVRVVPTAAALRFVGAATWAALSGNPVAGDVWDDVHEVPHVRLGREADLVVVAPATADLLARMAHGLADDLLTNVLLTARCPVVVAPAMHTEMWEHPATRANVATLRGRGVVVLDPASGRLTGADSGAGRLPEPAALHAVAAAVLERRAAPDGSGHLADLAGRSVVVSAGGTREPLDPVRFLGNRSSGRQGMALAAAAVARGARVTVVQAATDVDPPAGARVVTAGTARELRAAVLEAAAEADAVVMAAAVADFRPAHERADKIKKDDGGGAPTLELVRNPDVLVEVVGLRRPAQVVVGFAAETGDADGDVLAHARRKLARKGCDLLVANDVSGGATFGSGSTSAVLLGADGSERAVGPGTKGALAHAVWDAVADLWAAGTTAGGAVPAPR